MKNNYSCIWSTLKRAFCGVALLGGLVAGTSFAANAQGIKLTPATQPAPKDPSIYTTTNIESVYFEHNVPAGEVFTIGLVFVNTYLKPEDGKDRMWVDYNENGKYDTGVDLYLPLNTESPITTLYCKAPMPANCSKVTIYAPVRHLVAPGLKEVKGTGSNAVVHWNHITKLDLTKNRSLANLNIPKNKIGVLDLTQNHILNSLLIWDCDLTEIKMEGEYPLLGNLDGVVELYYNRLSAEELNRFARKLPNRNGVDDSGQPKKNGVMVLYYEGVPEEAIATKEGNILDKGKAGDPNAPGIFKILLAKNWSPRFYYGNFDMGVFDEEGIAKDEEGEIHDIPTSIFEVTPKVAQEIELFPTVAQKSITVRIPFGGGVPYRIYSLQGAMVQSGKLFNLENRIDIAQFPEGQYFFAVEGYITQRFYVRH